MWSLINRGGPLGHCSLGLKLPARAVAAAGAALLLLAACSSPTEPVACETRWADVQWTSLGLDGFGITALAETPWGLFAATDSDGVFQQDGSTGQWTGRGLEGVTITTLAFAGPPDRLLAGGRTLRENSSPPDRVLVATEDAGASWLPSDGGFPDQADALLELAVDTVDRRRVFAASWAGVMRSRDSGGSWDRVATVGATGLGLLPGTEVVLVGFSTDIMTPRFLRSEDNGESWELIELPRDAVASPQAFAVDPVTPSRVWMGAGAAVKRSEDAGITWSDYQVLGTGNMIGLAAVGDAVVAIVARDAPGQQDLQLHYSCDAGDSWEAVMAPSPITGAQAVTVSGDGALLVGTTGAGVWRVEAIGR